MGHAHTADQKIENPGALKASGLLNGFFGACIAIGLIAFFSAYANDPVHAWSSFLRSHFYFMSLSLAALFFVAIQWATTSMWSAPVRRLAEGMTAYIPFIFVSSILVFLGSKTLFLWTHPDLFKGDMVLEGKMGYLNMPFLIIRTLFACVGWIFFAKKMVGNSLSVDQGAAYRPVYDSSRKLSIAYLIFFAITFSMASFDQLMSLDPHFFSTMFAVYNFGGAYQGFFALLAIMMIIMRRTGYLDKLTNENHLHDISKLMFAFTVFWAYTGFSQFMLIWYANLPEETGYFLLRFNEHWQGWSIGLFVGRFFVPFFLLLPRGNKRSEGVVFLTAAWILVMHYLDLNWQIQPIYFQDGPRFAFADIGVWLGFFGVFGMMVSRFYRKHNLVAIKDPYLADSVFHHHV